MGGARGKSWSEEEDIAIVNAYLKVSNDCETGAGQTSEVLWSNVFKEFVRSCPDHQNRNTDRVSKRWYNTIQPMCQKFSGLFGRVKRELPSGHIHQEILDMTLNQWSLEFKPKKFNLLHTWEILRFEDKFNPEQSDACEFVGDIAKLEEITKKAKSERPPGKKASVKALQDNNARIEMVKEFRKFTDAMRTRDERLRGIERQPRLRCSVPVRTICLKHIST